MPEGDQEVGMGWVEWELEVVGWSRVGLRPGLFITVAQVCPCSTILTHFHTYVTSFNPTAHKG